MSIVWIFAAFSALQLIALYLVERTITNKLINLNYFCQEIMARIYYQEAIRKPGSPLPVPAGEDIAVIEREALDHLQQMFKKEQ